MASDMWLQRRSAQEAGRATKIILDISISIVSAGGRAEPSDVTYRRSIKVIEFIYEPISWLFSAQSRSVSMEMLGCAQDTTPWVSSLYINLSHSEPASFFDTEVFARRVLFRWSHTVRRLWFKHGAVRTHPDSNSTFLDPDAAHVAAVVIPFSAAELEHVDGHGGSDLLLGRAHAVIENLEEPLGLLLLVQLVVEGVLGGRQSGYQRESQYESVSFNLEMTIHQICLMFLSTANKKSCYVSVCVCVCVCVCVAHLYLCVSSLQEGDAQQDAFLKHPVVLGVDDEVNHQLWRPDVVQETLDLHHAAARLVRVQHGRAACRDWTWTMNLIVHYNIFTSNLINIRTGWSDREHTGIHFAKVTFRGGLGRTLTHYFSERVCGLSPAM